MFGEQPRDKVRIKLNTNENPYPPSPGVIECLKNAANEDIRLYPDTESRAFCETVARYYGLSPRQVFPGNGSDEVLAFLFQAFFGPNELIAFPDVTYSFYPVYANLYRIPYREIPLREDFTIDFSAYPQGLKGILFANPNAPTGIYIPPEEIESLLKSRPDTLIVVDEAYVDFERIGGSPCEQIRQPAGGTDLIQIKIPCRYENRSCHGTSTAD